MQGMEFKKIAEQVKIIAQDAMISLVVKRSMCIKEIKTTRLEIIIYILVINNLVQRMRR